MDFTSGDAILVSDQPATAGGSVLLHSEIRELFGVHDPTLFGNRVAALTAAIGLPPCVACNDRRDWLNQAHAWLRANLGQLIDGNPQ